jgi:ribosomal-protein-alanine N-acetyltransferase
MDTVKNMRIETSRLIIRPYKEDDMMECFQLMQDKELFKYLDMDVMSIEEYKGLFNWIIDSYNTGIDEDFKYSFAITLKENGIHVGWCGIGGIEYNHSAKEIYYLIGKSYWGNGYAREAAKALLDYGFNIIGLNEIVAICKPDNIGSRKVIENMGLKYRYIVKGLPKEFDFYNGEPFFSLGKNEYLQKIEQ